MSAILDIVVGTVVGGLILLMALTASDRTVQDYYNLNSDAIVQQNLTQISRIMEFDLKKMGYGIPEFQRAGIVRVALPGHIKFLAQLNSARQTSVQVAGVNVFDQVADTVEYQVVPADSFNFGDTTITMYDVSRRLSIAGLAEEQMSIGRVSNPNVFRYLDQAGRPAAVIPAIDVVEINLAEVNPQVVLSPELVMQRTQNIQDREFRLRELRRILRPAFLRQARLISRNLRR